jgi:TolB protein
MAPSVRKAVACGLVAAIVLVCGVFASAASATYPGRNGLIAFRADTGNGYDLYTIRPDGTGQMQLTNLAGDEVQPHWSRDSRLIAFEYDPATPTSNDFCNVAHIRPNGANLVVLPEGNGDQCEGSPTFGPRHHGRWIYYEGFDGVSRDAIFRMDLQGHHRHFVSDCQGSGVTDPEIAPNGKMISFTCFSDQGQALFDADINGSHLRQLTPWAFNVGNKSDWAPNGRRIMVISTHDEGTPDAQVNTATIRPDGTGLFWVTHYPAGGLLAYGNSYSPDGRWILLRIENGDQYALFKIHPNGQGLQQVTPFSDFRPRGMAWGSHP